MPPVDALGALEQEPAARELVEIMASIRTLDPAWVRDYGATVTAAGESARQAGSTLTEQAAAVGSGWQGAGAQAFADWTRAFAGAGDRAATGTAEVTGALEQVARTLEGLTVEVGTAVEQAIAAAGAARREAATAPPAVPGGPPGAPPAVADAMAAAALAAPTAAASDAVARAEATLAGLADRVIEAARSVTGFRTLPPVGTTRTAPDGTPRPWEARPPVPDPAPAPVPAPAPDREAAAGPGTRAATGGGPDDEDPGGSGGGAGGGTSGGSGGGSGGAPDLPGSGDLVGSGGAAGTSAPPPGEVGDWIREAMRILAENGTDPTLMDAADIALIVENESGGDPAAINQVDSNAARGVPSQGLMQTIPPTFEAHKLPGHDDIANPIDNIIAGVRYAIARYGSTSQVPGVEAVAGGGAYVPY